MNKLKTIFNKIYSQRKKAIPSLFCGIVCTLFTIITSLIFVSGGINSSTNIYKSATYLADSIAKKENLDYVPLIVEERNEDHQIADTATEYRALYGAFGNRITNYSSTVNADKANEILFADIESTNLSFLAVNVGFQNQPEKEGTKYYGGYRHDFLPLHLMYQGTTKTNVGDFSFLYLSQSQADRLIEAMPEFDNYDDLYGSSVTLTFNGVPYSWTIDNIYLEDDYLYDALSNALDEFVLGYRYYPEGFHRQASFFMNKHEYENKFFMEYAMTNYSPKHFTYKISNYKINLNDSLVLHFLDNGRNTLSIFLLTLSILLAIGGLYLIFVNKYYMNFMYDIYFGLSFLIPYWCCKIIYSSTRNLIFFSPFSTMTILYFLIAFVLAIFVFNAIAKIKPHLPNDGSFKNVSI